MKPSGKDQAAPAAGPWEECFQAAVQLALRAGQIIRKALTEEKRVSTKTSAADLVTETDHLVEDLIISELRERFPSHRFIAEEAPRTNPGETEICDLSAREYKIVVLRKPKDVQNNTEKKFTILSGKRNKETEIMYELSRDCGAETCNWHTKECISL
uniref:Inositol-phosphate phosphatase n=1 Tax=Piliocolobus tephrosceles TaxID=591936 RepID=A0A8C9GQA7_9PRIM